MPMTTVSNLSGERGRTFAIEVTGSPNQAKLRTSAYTIKVPYSSLSQTIHSIGQRGGKVVNVTMLTTPFSELEDIPVASGILVPFDDEVAAPQAPAKATSNPQPESRRQQQKSKKR
jgi:phycocyanin-associated, rod